MAVARSAALAQQPRHLLVDHLRGVLAEAARLGHFAAEKRVVVHVAESDRAEPFASCPNA